MDGETRSFRTIWISDIHLGTRGCKARFLLDFLRRHDSDYLYLVGDIVDLWHLKCSRSSWMQEHNDVIQKILRRARKGTEVVYVPGNHDEAARLWAQAYDLSILVNHWFNLARRRLGYPYWSLSAYLKHKVKNAVEFIASYEAEMIAETKRRGLDGVVCGHIHHAEIREVDGVLYCNDGDWVESCTALAEDFTGNLSIIRWAEIRERRLEEVAA